MKIKSIIIALTLSGLYSLEANASTDIKVHGIITPSACSATISGGTDLDWGKMPHSDLKPEAFNTLPAKSIAIQINCPSKTSFAFWAVDPNHDSAFPGDNVNGRAGHADLNRNFGLGFDPVTRNKLGNFTLNPIRTIVDGTTNEAEFGFISTPDHSYVGTFGHVPFKNWSYTQLEDYTPLNANLTTAAGKSLTWEFEVEPQLNWGSRITSAQEVPWAGMAQINIRYF